MKNVSKNTIGVLFFVVALLVPAVFSSIVYASSVSVTTYNASSIGEYSASLNGFVSNPGGRSAVYFEWGENYLTGSATNIQEFNNSSGFNTVVSGLLPGRTYYFRAAARDTATGEISYGQTLSFTSGEKQYPSQQVPTIETRSASNVTNVSAVLNGAVNPQRSSDTVRWFEWGMTQSLGNQTPKANQGTGSGDFSYSLSDLKPNTTYYYKAAAQNANGPVFGSIFSFQTGGPNYLPTNPNTNVNPIAITQTPSGVSKTAATLNGLALPGGAIATRGWFEWGITGDLGNTTIIQNIGNASSIPFSQSITNLSPGTSYYFRAVIENERGKSQGNIVRLVTDSSTVNPPLVTETEPRTPPKTIATTTKTATNTASVGVLSGCFSNSLTGWLLLILLVILLVIAIDHIVDRYQKRKEEKKRSETDIQKEGGNNEEEARTIK